MQTFLISIIMVLMVCVVLLAHRDERNLDRIGRRRRQRNPVLTDAEIEARISIMDRQIAQVDDLIKYLVELKK